MKNKIQMISVLSLIAINSLPLTCPAALADSLSGQASNTSTVRGTVNPAGELRDESGRTIGKIMMASPGTAFDISRMSVRSDGSVVDSSGAVVGRMMFADQEPRAATTPISPSTPVAPVRSVTPVPTTTTEYQPEILGPGRRSTERAVTVPRQSTNSAASEKRNNKAVVMGIKQEDLNSRRAKVASRIDSDLSEGRITEEQAAGLKSELEATIQTQEKLERRGIIRDRNVLSLYKRWDLILGKLDEYLARNARNAIGLRTK